MTKNIIFEKKVYFYLDEKFVNGNITNVQTFSSNHFFVHGVVPNGTFSVAWYKGFSTVHVHFSGPAQYEGQGYLDWKNPVPLNLVDMNLKYYTKDKKKIEYFQKMKKKIPQPFFPTQQQLNTKYDSATKIPNLKILVLYTRNAVTICPGEDCVLSTIALAIGNFNIALQNSRVNMTVSYVAERIKEYNYFNETSSTDMNFLLDKMGNVISTKRRYILGCQAVHLTTASIQYCGLANYDFNGRTDGYSVSNLQCIGGYMSLAHEVGHNIGLQHDPSGFSDKTLNRGYCWDDASGLNNCHRSIMAYSTCVTPKGNKNCDRVKYFSTPDVIELGNPIGTASFNNAQQLRNNIQSFINLFTPSTISPIATPTYKPTINPSRKPTRKPTNIPSWIPTWIPTYEPTFEYPTYKPTSLYPTYNPTSYPTFKPIRKPIKRRPFPIPISFGHAYDSYSVIPTLSPTFRISYDDQIKSLEIVIAISSCFILSLALSGCLCLYRIWKQNMNNSVSLQNIIQQKEYNLNEQYGNGRNDEESNMEKYPQSETAENHSKIIQQRYRLYSLGGKPRLGETPRKPIL